MDLRAGTRRVAQLLDQDRCAEAEGLLMSLLQQAPEEPSLHRMMAVAHRHQDKHQSALHHAQYAVSRAPEDADMYTALAACHLSLNQYRQAEDAARQAIVLAPDEAHYRVTLAWVYAVMSRWQASYDLATEALTLDPANIDAANTRAEASRHLGAHDAAEQDLREALRRDPLNATSHANLGWARLHQGDAKGAVDQFMEALRLEPNHPYARQGLMFAIKAKNPIYRPLLAFILWMDKWPARVRVGILIAGFLGFRLLLDAAREGGFEVVAYTILGVWVLIVLGTWLMDPLFNLILLTQRRGRLSLSQAQVSAGLGLGVMLLLIIAAVTVWAVMSIGEPLGAERSGLAGSIAELIAIQLGFLTLPLVNALSHRGRSSFGWRMGVTAGLLLLLVITWAAAASGDMGVFDLAGRLFRYGAIAAIWGFILAPPGHVISR